MRPVGLIRSPTMQNGCSGPIRSSLLAERRTVSMIAPFGYAGAIARRRRSSSLALATAADASEA